MLVGPLDREFLRQFASDGTVCQIVQSPHLAGATKLDQSDLDVLTGRETLSCPRRNIEVHTKGLFAIEFQFAVCFEEVEVAADLDRPVSRVDDGNLGTAPTCVDLDLAFLRRDLPGLDALNLLLSRTNGLVTSFVPVFKTGSTCRNGISSATPGMTSSVVRTVEP